MVLPYKFLSESARQTIAHRERGAARFDHRETRELPPGRLLSLGPSVLSSIDDEHQIAIGCLRGDRARTLRLATKPVTKNSTTCRTPMILGVEGRDAYRSMSAALKAIAPSRFSKI